MTDFRVRQLGRTLAKYSGPKAEDDAFALAKAKRFDGPVIVQRQRRSEAPSNTDGRWYWVRHALFEQWRVTDAEERET